MWTLPTALRVIREAQIAARSYGYHICLGGGVLNNGSSVKDLDLYFLPLLGHHLNLDDLMQSLDIGWGPHAEHSFSGGNEEGPFVMKLYFNHEDGAIEAFIVGVPKV